MESHRDCSYDRLRIYDGPSSNSPRKANLCGRSTYSGLESSGNSLFLKFNSDGSTSDTGFQIHYSLIGKKNYLELSTYL